jgi:hypothetical protein
MEVTLYRTVRKAHLPPCHSKRRATRCVHVSSRASFHVRFKLSGMLSVASFAVRSVYVKPGVEPFERNRKKRAWKSNRFFHYLAYQFVAQDPTPLGLEMNAALPIGSPFRFLQGVQECIGSSLAH